VEKIAAHFNWTPQTVREVLHRWQKLGMEGMQGITGPRRKTEVERRRHRVFNRMPQK
jgi:transposase